MKYFLLIYLFTFNAIASLDCESSGIELYGDIKFTDKQEFNKFPKRWNVNSDMFDDLYIKNKKNLNIKSYEIKAETVSKTKLIYEQKSKVEELKDSYQKLSKARFSKGIIRNLKLLPMKLTLKILNNENKIFCTSTYSLEVIQ
jgi:hypothetical protein